MMQGVDMMLGTIVGYSPEPGLYGPLYVASRRSEDPPAYGCCTALNKYFGEQEVFLKAELRPADELWTQEALDAYLAPPVSEEE